MVVFNHTRCDKRRCSGMICGESSLLSDHRFGAESTPRIGEDVYSLWWAKVIL